MPSFGKGENCVASHKNVYMGGLVIVDILVIRGLMNVLEIVKL